MSDKLVKVSLAMGSKSDWDILAHASHILEELEVSFESRIISAHRTPKRLYEYASALRGRGVQVVIAAAGGAAHLPGMIASMTNVPVLGVPIDCTSLNGMDSLLSIVQMPKGVPVGTLAIGKNGSINSALLAARIISNSDEDLLKRLDAWIEKQTNSITEVP